MKVYLVMAHYTDGADVKDTWVSGIYRKKEDAEKWKSTITKARDEYEDNGYSYHIVEGLLQ